VGGLGRFGYTLVLPSIRDDLGLSYTLSGLLATVNFAGYLLAALSGGIMSRLGVRGATVAGLIAMLAGWVASGFAPTYPGLLALQLLCRSKTSGD
jgi:MFS family permease